MADFELRIDTDADQKVARLKLFGAGGSHAGSNEVRLPEHSSALWEGLFDTRRYVRRYEGAMIFDGQEEPATAGTLLERLGTFLGEEVLGEDIVRALAGPARNVLTVRLPTTDRDVLAAAFPRVPWEIARLSDDTVPRNLVVRAVTEEITGGDVEITGMGNAETVRVLAVFAEAPGSRPLAMRREREELRRLFADEIMPHRDVEIDVLCHGVNRRRLKEAIRARRGYHVVHWSGHGHHNALELQGEPNDCISGKALVELFVEAGGFIPRIFFLSACHSGAFLRVKDWESLQEALERDEREEGVCGPKAATAPAEDRQLDDAIQNPSGYTGTALALLKADVPQVVAMRYAVGDEYARRLAVAFYHRLLADPEAGATEEALAMARTEVAEDAEQIAYHAVDHATPLMFGRPGVLLDPARKRSRQMDRLRPQPQPLLTGGGTELDPPEVFVGRGGPLSRLADEWLGEDAPAAALIQGLAGLGKTALAAEAIHLWHERFDYVFCFQAKPTPLQFDDFCRRLDQRLTLESPTYRDRCEHNALRHIHLKHDADLFAEPEARYDRMRANLIEALREEAILVVIDNFENNLEEVEREAGSAVYACADPAWDDLLEALARDLPGTRSRLLVTGRHRPAALAEGERAVWIPLGPLPMGEAALFARSHSDLRRLLFSEDESDRALVRRLLKVSRGHPLILDRFARLAGDAAALEAALDLVRADGWQNLPDLFEPGEMDDVQREVERHYLEDVAMHSIDLLIERLTPDARRLLRVITVANEPVTEPLIAGVWKERADAPPVEPLLAELHGAGLLTREEQKEGPANYAFHELVRERMAAWMAAHDKEFDGRTDDGIRITYGERYAKYFRDLYHEDRNAAGEAGRRALAYFVPVGAYDRLLSFTSWMITGVNDPPLLRSVVDILEDAVEQAPPGTTRWNLRTSVADALRKSGQPEQALPFYAQAAEEAEEAGNWADLGAIMGNWASALAMTGDLQAAQQFQLRSAEAHRRAGNPDVNAVGSELEALRIDVMRGEAEAALPEIESRLDRIRNWWAQTEAGQSVPEAPDRTFLGRALVSGLSTAMQANYSRERWQMCINLLREQKLVKHSLNDNELELARTRFNLYWPLLRLDRLAEAQRILEECLDIFRSSEAVTEEARCISAFADLHCERNEIDEAIALERRSLGVRNSLSDPSDRATSHNKLGNYLERAAKDKAAAMHHTAALTYALLSGRKDMCGFRNLGVRARRALAEGERYGLPRLDEILAREEFAALRRFLDNHGVDRAALQAQLDGLVERAHQQAQAAGQTPLADMPPRLAELVEPILAAAADGEDPEPLLAELRGKLLDAGSDEEEVDRFIEAIRRQLPSGE